MLGKEWEAVTSASVVRWYEADKGPRLTLSRSPFQKTFYKKKNVVWPFSAPIVGWQEQQWADKWKAGKEREREREREVDEEEERRRLHTSGSAGLIVSRRQGYKGAKKRGKTGDKRGEWYLESENRRERHTGRDGLKDGGWKWCMCSH